MVFFLFLAFFFFLHPQPVQAKLQPVSYQVTVSATLGEPKLILFGYTSPQAQVELKGHRVSETTVARQDGYFHFDQIFLFASSETNGFPELCLTTIDQQKRISFPTCLPPLPTGPYEITVGPVLLPPTFSLSQGLFRPGEQAIVQGLTIPEAEVTVFLANPLPGGNRFLSLVPSAQAYFLPQYTLKADKDGSFEFNLPANKPATWRLFTTAHYLQSPTPKSNTLTFKILSGWGWFWLRIRKLIVSFLKLIRPYLLILMILIELLILGLFFYKHLMRKKKKAELEISGT